MQNSRKSNHEYGFFTRCHATSGIWSSVPGGDGWFNPYGGYKYFDGTSMATPFVSGAAGIYLGRFPSSTPATLRVNLEFIHLFVLWACDLSFLQKYVRFGAQSLNTIFNWFFMQFKAALNIKYWVFF